jgi:HNH endonuclease
VPPSPYRKRKRAGKTLYDHRLVMEAKLGRKLSSDEHVHHKNEQKKDNAPENLEVKTPKDHGRHHFAKHPIEKTCAVCERVFEPQQPHRARAQVCGIECRRAIIMQKRLGARFWKLDIEEIRHASAAGESHRSLGRRYGVGRQTIARIAEWSTRLAEAVGRSIARALQLRRGNRG